MQSTMGPTYATWCGKRSERRAKQPLGSGDYLEVSSPWQGTADSQAHGSGCHSAYFYQPKAHALTARHSPVACHGPRSTQRTKKQNAKQACRQPGRRAADQAPVGRHVFYLPATTSGVWDAGEEGETGRWVERRSRLWLMSHRGGGEIQLTTRGLSHVLRVEPTANASRHPRHSLRILYSEWSAEYYLDHWVR